MGISDPLICLSNLFWYTYLRMCCLCVQESRMGGVTFQNHTTGYAGGFNPTGHSMHSMYNHATAGPPFPNNALMRPPFVGTPDITNLSPVEVYRQEHEVTATVCLLI